MKKLLSILVLTALVVAGCDKYDDTDIQRRIGELEKNMQNLTGYQTLLQNLSAGKTVTAYSQSGNEITLTFSDSKSLTFNIKGEKGDSVKGDPGAPGENGKTPQFKIENETWKVSYDEGKTWTDVGSAIDRSLIKDIKPNAAGDTLNITLADGTVIPVFYGEKEKYGFEIADGRRCFSILESLATQHSRTITVPYTLTGDISDKADVDIETRVTTASSMSIGYYQVKVEKTDAKSGTITAQMRADSEGSGWDGGEYYYNFPEMVLEITAHFPDGTSSYKKLYIIGYELYLEPDEDTWDLAYVEYDSDLKMNVIRLPKEAGEFKFFMRAGTTSYTTDYFYKYYDGEPFKPQKFGDVFYEVRRIADNNGYFVSVTVNEDPVVTAQENWWEETYTVTVKFSGNALGRERYNDLQFWKRESGSSAGGLTRIRLIQAY